MRIALLVPIFASFLLTSACHALVPERPEVQRPEPQTLTLAELEGLAFLDFESIHWSQDNDMEKLSPRLTHFTSQRQFEAYCDKHVELGRQIRKHGDDHDWAKQDLVLVEDAVQPEYRYPIEIYALDRKGQRLMVYAVRWEAHGSGDTYSSHFHLVAVDKDVTTGGVSLAPITVARPHERPADRPLHLSEKGGIPRYAPTDFGPRVAP